MATYSKRAAIQSIKKKKRSDIKTHKYLFKAITGYLDKLAIHLSTTYPDIEFTSDNIQDYARHFFGRDLDTLENNFLLMKIYEQRSKSE